MTYEEIDALLREKGMSATLVSLQEAVREEAGALHAVYPRSPSALEEMAQNFFAEDITRLLATPAAPDPATVLSHRSRYMTCWAIATLLAQHLPAPAPEPEEEGDTDVSDQFVALCKANADLGMKCVELMVMNDQIRVEMDNQVAMLHLELDQLRKGEGQVHGLVNEEMVSLANDILVMAKNLVWAAQTVHNGHHAVDVVGATDGAWQDCRRGICGSMGHMLAQVGLDKDLKPTERRR
jgi:hypothetical protein